VHRLSVQASDHLIEKQMEAYSTLIDTAEDEGGEKIFSWRFSLHLMIFIFFSTQVLVFSWVSDPC